MSPEEVRKEPPAVGFCPRGPVSLRMLEVSEAARSELEGLRIRWTVLERAGEPEGSLPDASAAVPKRDPDALSEDPVAKAYRELFWDLGIDPTKQRPAGEALARRVARDDRLPRILPVVDAYNLTSAATLVPLSAFDRASLKAPLTLDLAGEGERFDPIGGEPTKVEEGRPVWRDEEGIVSLLAYRDGDRTALDEGTKAALLVAVGPRVAGPRVLPEALRKIEQYASIVGWTFSTTPETIAL